MNFWKKLFHGYSAEKSSPTMQSIVASGEDPAILYQTASEFFIKERFKEALDLLETLQRNDSASAAVHFLIGNTYVRLGGQLCKDDNDCLVPWLRKSVTSFKRACEVAHERGGLPAEQREFAAEAALHGERVIERHSPSIPEEERRRIYADFMETKETEFLLNTNIEVEMARASRMGVEGIIMMKESINRAGAFAEAAALDKVIARHGITRGQLLAIAEEGREKNWHFKSHFSGGN